MDSDEPRINMLEIAPTLERKVTKIFYLSVKQLLNYGITYYKSWCWSYIAIFVNNNITRYTKYICNPVLTILVIVILSLIIVSSKNSPIIFFIDKWLRQLMLIFSLPFNINN